MKCGGSDCTGVHNGSQPYAAWCPVMKERKRVRDGGWYYRLRVSGGLRYVERLMKAHSWRLRRESKKVELKLAAMDAQIESRSQQAIAAGLRVRRVSLGSIGRARE